MPLIEIPQDVLDQLADLARLERRTSEAQAAWMLETEVRERTRRADSSAQRQARRAKAKADKVADTNADTSADNGADTPPPPPLPPCLPQTPSNPPSPTPTPAPAPSRVRAHEKVVAANLVDGADEPQERTPRSGGHLLNMQLGAAAGGAETWAFTADDLKVLLPAAEYFGTAARELPQKILVALGKRYPDAQDRWLAMPPDVVAAWCAEVAKKTRETKGANRPAAPGLVSYAAVIVGDRIEANQDLLATPEPAAVPVAQARRFSGERRSTQQRNMDVLRNAVAKHQAAEMAVGQ